MSASNSRIWGLAVVATALWGAGPAWTQELWNGARVGMTPAEVQSAFPQAAKGEPSVDGDEMTLRVPALRAGGHDAVAFLDFTSDRLRSVELVLSPEQVGGAIDARDVQTQLSSKYGAPIDCDEDGARCEWRNRGIGITLIATRGRAGDSAEVRYGVDSPVVGSENRSNPTPVALVRAFYADLGAGDGEEASQLVVPEKRRGPFSPAALTGFYASLPQPLRLVNASPHSADSVFVRYRFTAAGGNICDGNADVRTAWVGERRLIESIHSYSGC